MSNRRQRCPRRRSPRCGEALQLRFLTHLSAFSAPFAPRRGTSRQGTGQTEDGGLDGLDRRGRCAPRPVRITRTNYYDATAFELCRG